MARPSEEFALAWSSLTGHDSKPGWHAIALSSAGPVELRAGRRSPENAEAILLGFPSARLMPSEKLPDGQGFAVERADPEGTDQLWLALTRRSAGSAELFAAMACDVAGALDVAAAMGCSEDRLLKAFIRRVGAWQEFMRKGSQILSPEAEIGLVGELTVLRAIMDAGVPSSAAVEAWVGPLDGVQDFELGTGAIEVKATLAVTSFPAWIGSLEQLDDVLRQPLFLAGVRLRQIDTGQTLPDLVLAMREAVRDDAEATRVLDERLLAAGYFDLHADRYARRFGHVETRMMEVTDRFPRLTQGQVPAGITRAKYEIDLDKITGAGLAAEAVMKRLGAI